MELPPIGQDEDCCCSSLKELTSFFFICTLRLGFEHKGNFKCTAGLDNKYLKEKLYAKFALLSTRLEPVDKKTNKKKQRGCLSGVQDDKRCENRYNVLCKDKKSLELKPAKLLSKCFCEI